MKTLNEPAVLIFPLNKRKIQRLCFQKPQKLSIIATYIVVCFTITGVPLACKYFSCKNIPVLNVKNLGLYDSSWINRCTCICTNIYNVYIIMNDDTISVNSFKIST